MVKQQFIGISYGCVCLHMIKECTAYGLCNRYNEKHIHLYVDFLSAFSANTSCHSWVEFFWVQYCTEYKVGFVDIWLLLMNGYDIFNMQLAWKPVSNYHGMNGAMNGENVIHLVEGWCTCKPAAALWQINHTPLCSLCLLCLRNLPKLNVLITNKHL